ncbi:hypothetical protein BBP08_11320 [Streptococcus agalactiae]|nr:hypothetical protein B1H24_06910 [Streptococcus agalactiae]ASA79910.1 hypothetical protein BB161_06940 [Streptococcus agalactiae]AWZ28435.1 hypothetical protein CDH85_07190 [Streptococcus agalactiae]AZL56550.1 hypothetical protein DNK17_09505 [Streptococcus agalactiae]KAA8960217.1 hypothetical protein F3146_04630 [Streptococcus agalactiae]
MQILLKCNKIKKIMEFLIKDIKGEDKIYETYR